MKTIKPWLSAFRLRTLPLSISGIIVGSCFAHFNGFFNIYIFLLAILTTVCFQILSNLANDYGDGIKGTDNEQRIGPERAIQSGAITSHQMFEAIKINILLAIVLSFSLIYLSFGQGHFLYVLVFFFLAGASIIAAMNYTMGNKAYGYRGLGDLFVFIFFGLLSVIGSYFLYTKHLDHLIVLPSIVIGLLSVGVLNLNNMRDIENDKQASKITLAVRLGPKLAKMYHKSLIISAMIISLIFGVLYYKSPSNLLFLIAFLPLSIHLKKINEVTSPKDYDPQLKVLALSTFILAILLGVGYIL